MKKFNVITLLISLIVVASVAFVYFGENNEHRHNEHAGHSHADHEQPQSDQDSVLSVDVKYVDGTIHLLTAKQKGTEQSVWYQSSVDHGKEWSQAINIINANNDFKFKRGNDARLAVSGDLLVAVWMTRAEGVPHNAGPMVAMRSDDKGQTWQKTTMPADWDGPHGFFAMDGNDQRINLVWLDSREKSGKGSQGLHFTSTQDGGLTWEKNQTLDSQTCACCWNSARFNNDGEFYVLYRDKNPSDMALGQVNVKQQWQRLSTVGEFNWDFQGCPHIGGGLAIDNRHNDIYTTVGTGLEDQQGIYYLNSVDKGQSWSVPVQLGDSSAVHSDVAVNENGQLVAIWDRMTESGFQIVYAESGDHGVNWTEAKLVSELGQSSSHPRVIATKNSFLLVWTESDDKGVQTLKMITIPDAIVDD